MRKRMVDLLLDKDDRVQIGLRLAKVTAINTGNNTVSIQLGGSTVAVAGVHRLASYSPTTNDLVWVIQNGPDLLVLGKQA